MDGDTTMHCTSSQLELLNDALRRSEQRFAALFNLTAVGIAQVSLGGEWLLVNQKVCDILGYDCDELKKMTVAQLTVPEDLEKQQGYLRRLLGGEIADYSMEKRCIRKDGEQVWVKIDVALVPRSDDEPGYLLTVLQDINERKQAEQALRQSEEKFYKIFKLAPIGITISTLSDGRFVDINEAGERLSGFSRQEVIGRSALEFGIWQDADERNRVIGEVLSRGEVRDRELMMKEKSGRTFWGLYSGVVIDIRGEKHLLSLVSDIGERKQALQEQERAQKELEAANRELALRVAERTAELSETIESLQDEVNQRVRMAKALEAETGERLNVQAQLREKELLLLHQSRLAAMGEMIGNIAHQWRQPLNLLALLIQELPVASQKGEFSEDYLEHSVKKMLETIRHMSQTIDDFRNFFRPCKEKVDFSLRQTVEKTVSLLEGSFKAQQITVALVASGEPVVTGFPNEYSQALLNILINARDAFTARPVDNPTITIEIGSAQGRSVVTVTDNAGGIPQEVIGSIFDPYFTTKGPDQGTGVGLFLSKTIIEKNMGGRLSVRNVVGGAQFLIEV